LARRALKDVAVKLCLDGMAIGMLRTLYQAFTSPVAGPVGFVLSFVLLGMLALTSVSATHNEAILRGRVTQLMTENQKTGMALHARLAACEGGPADQGRVRATNANLTPEQRAQRLSGEPAGFDVCARMESADRAVHETLR
jgi:hypothetical protein